MERIPSDSADYKVVEDIRDYSQLGGLKKEQDRVQQQIYMFNALMANKQAPLMSLIRLQSMGINDEQILNMDRLLQQYNGHQHSLQSIPSLIHDLLRRLKKNPNTPPTYIEVFTMSGVDTEAAKKYFFEKTGLVPAIYDNGTHYVTNHKLTLEMLKEISDSADVLEVAGDYTGKITARGSSLVHSEDCPLRNPDYVY